MEKPGCGLKFIGSRIDEQYSRESERMKALDIRLIGSQAISLAQYSFRLIDILKLEYQNEAQEIKRLALTQICLYLRDIGALKGKFTPKLFFDICSDIGLTSRK